MQLVEALENALLSFSFSVRTVSLGQPPGQQDRQCHQYWRDAVCEGDDHDLSHACLPTKGDLQTMRRLPPGLYARIVRPPGWRALA